MEATAAQTLSPAGVARSTSGAWDLLLALTARDIRARYQGTVLSFVWWVARPLALGLVLYFALGRVLRLEIPNYGVFIMSGLFPWFWFQGSLTSASGSLVGNAGLIKKVRFPRLVLPLSAVLFNTAQFLLTIPMLVVFVFISGLEPSPEWIIGIPILLLVQSILLVGMSALISSVNVFFRDLGAMLEVVLVLMFYVTPIIYPLSRVPEEFQPLMKLNPVAPLIEGWHRLFVAGSFSLFDLWPSVLFAAGFLIVGLAVFGKLERYFADAL